MTKSCLRCPWENPSYTTWNTRWWFAWPDSRNVSGENYSMGEKEDTEDSQSLIFKRRCKPIFEPEKQDVVKAIWYFIYENLNNYQCILPYCSFVFRHLNFDVWPITIPSFSNRANLFFTASTTSSGIMPCLWWEGSISNLSFSSLTTVPAPTTLHLTRFTILLCSDQKFIVKDDRPSWVTTNGIKLPVFLIDDRARPSYAWGEFDDEVISKGMFSVRYT